MNDLSIFADFQFSFLIKIFVCAFLFIYCIFVFVVLTNIRSLNKVIFVSEANASQLLQNLAILYFVASLSLFFLSLVIL